MQVLFFIDREIVIILTDNINKLVLNKIIIYKLRHTLFQNVGFLLRLSEQGYL
jgi:hypothetical protein